MSDGANGNSFPVYALFDSFGNRQTDVTTPGSFSPFEWGGAWGYQNEYSDASVPGLGLVYIEQRYYDPAIGRFISPDPIGYAGGLNLYAYAENDPDNGVDPPGLETWTVRWRYAIGDTVGEASSMAGRLEMKPEYPLRVTFDDGEEWTLETPHEVECNLEWFDSEDGDDSAVVVDRKGRPVRLKVEALTLLTCELKEDPEGRWPPE